MTFLGAIFLFALPLAAVPVVIHLLHRRRQDVVRWGAMQFLLEAVSRRRRFWRVDDWLLMLLRAGAVLALILALARPQIRGWLGTGGRRDVVLVLDLSLSMSKQDKEGTAFDRMQREAGVLLDQLSSGDYIRVVLAAGMPQWLTTEPVPAGAAQVSVLRERLSQLKPSLGGADLLAAVRQAVDAEAPADASSRVVALFTDGRAQGWPADAKTASQLLQKALSATPSPTVVNVIPVGGAESDVQNVAIEGLESTRVLAGVGEQLAIKARVRNFGTAPAEACSLAWSIDGQPLNVSFVEPLQSGQSSVISLEHTLDQPGVFKFACRADARDDLPLDNDAMLIVETRDKIPVLLVRTGGSDPLWAEQRFLLAALGRGKESDGAAAGKSVFEPTLVELAELERKDLAGYPCVIFTNVPPLTKELVAKLTEYVSAGGGLWLAAGELTDAKPFNDLIHGQGEGLSPVALGAASGDAEKQTEFATIHPPARSHPATGLIGDTQRLDIDQVKIFRRFAFDDSRRKERVSVLLESGYGEPVAVERFVDRGRVIVQAFPLGMQWSNLPVCHVFVPYVHEWLWYLIQPDATPRNLPVNAPIVVKHADSDEPALLRTPLGEEIAIAPDGVDVYRYTGTAFPGEYSLKFGKGKDAASTPFYVLREPAESDLTPLDANQRQELAGAARFRFVTDALSWPADVPVSSPLAPVWSLLTTALIAFVSLELALISWSTWRRFLAANEPGGLSEAG